MKISKKQFTIAAIIILMLSTGCASIQSSLFMEDPLTAEEHNNLGVIYEREGKNDLAVREYKRAISSDGSLITPYINLGNVYFKEGELTLAEKSYKKALELDHMSLEAANNLASLYIESGEQYKEGLDIMISATKDIEPVPPYALDTMGALYLKLGDKKNAETYLRHACNNAKNDESLIEEIRANLWQLGINTRCGD